VAPLADAPAVSVARVGVDTTDENRCDLLGGSDCLLPFPSDRFRVRTSAGARIVFDRQSMPANVAGVHVNPTDWAQSDGFSPGSPVIVRLPDVDLNRSHGPGLADLAASLAAQSSIVVVDGTTGKRLPFWAELDALADPGTQPLVLLHPAVNWPEGHRISIGFRSMVTSADAPVAVSAAFRLYRDGQHTTDPTVEARRPQMERTFADLSRAGVDRLSLQLAWSFTVASAHNLAGRMLAMRNDAFGRLGDDSPAFTVTSVTNHPDARVYREVNGTFQTPLYMTGTGEPGSRLVLNASGIPLRQSGSFTAAFRCTVPASAVGANGRARPGRMALYGHGLLGSIDELRSDMVRDMSQRADIIYCATNLAGMSEDDLANVIKVLPDLSTFGSIPDRLQQGLLSVLFLGRLMKMTKGLSSDPAFQVDGTPVLVRSQLYYDGNSQGAILGGALCAVAQDLHRCVLGEAGMNYALLLDRSVDFDDYLNALLKPAYPVRDDRVLGTALISMLWDRGEADGYAEHLTAHPYADTPAKTILLLGAVGDHQVTEFSLRVEARTIGARAREPIVGPGRDAETDPGFGLTALGTRPWSGSGYVLVDTGSPSAPEGNTPPRPGHDPHDDTPNIPQVQKLKDGFLHPDGVIRDPCRTGRPCVFPVPAANAD
jgi:hypothetical protein